MERKMTMFGYTRNSVASATNEDRKQLGIKIGIFISKAFLWITCSIGATVLALGGVVMIIGPFYSTNIHDNSAIKEESVTTVSNMSFTHMFSTDEPTRSPLDDIEMPSPPPEFNDLINGYPITVIVNQEDIHPAESVEQYDRIVPRVDPNALVPASVEAKSMGL